MILALSRNCYYSTNLSHVSPSGKPHTSRQTLIIAFVSFNLVKRQEEYAAVTYKIVSSFLRHLLDYYFFNNTIY